MATVTTAKADVKPTHRQLFSIVPQWNILCVRLPAAGVVMWNGFQLFPQIANGPVHEPHGSGKFFWWRIRL